MGCCAEKQMIERLKVLRHASVLARQEANLTKRTMAVVKLTHHYYGEYYKGIDYDQAKADKLHIFRKLEPRKPVAV